MSGSQETVREQAINVCSAPNNCIDRNSPDRCDDNRGLSLERNHKPWQRRTFLAAKIAAAGSLIVWLVSSGRLQFERLSSVSCSVELTWLVVLVFGSLAVPAIRWWCLLRIQQVPESWRDVLFITWAAYFSALLLPGAASGDLAKSYLIVRRNRKAQARALSTVLADRFLGLYSHACLGMLGILSMTLQRGISGLARTIGISILILFVGMTLGILALCLATSKQLLLKFLPAAWCEAWDQSIGYYRTSHVGILGCFLLSVLSSVMTFASFAVAGTVLGDMVSWEGAFVAGPLVVLINCLPITPGGIGAAEAAASELFAQFGTPGGAELMIFVRLLGAFLTLPGVGAAVVLRSASVGERDDRLSVGEQSLICRIHNAPGE